jgi:hypothetical protein
MLDYGKYCLDKANKIIHRKTSTRADYPVDLTDDAVQGVTLQILSKEMTRERTILQRKLSKLCVFTTFIWMRQTNLNTKQKFVNSSIMKCQPY